ncbi:hypothetical protein BU25DRAFT_142772 [Macroventuria anomochaeta]|uniref:Uncharacterized protein n=1 Tax=Macroventuria anomochaeta TaxID=301207 RepID=A0ACB6SFT8_9PLEO|nr:uncharacterized protein BU25DRAFT_142772 [Macroventuria anomochaeta]KAF2632174.1 hypothetical protein BU25DRAFT_142772 [Macroventuria anomochaeta]
MPSNASALASTGIAGCIWIHRNPQLARRGFRVCLNRQAMRKLLLKLARFAMPCPDLRVCTPLKRRLVSYASQGWISSFPFNAVNRVSRRVTMTDKFHRDSQWMLLSHVHFLGVDGISVFRVVDFVYHWLAMDKVKVLRARVVSGARHPVKGLGFTRL